MRNLNIEEKVFPFNSLAISQIVNLLLTTTVSHAIINQLSIMQKIVKQNREKTKIKYSTLNIDLSIAELQFKVFLPSLFSTYISNNINDCKRKMSIMPLVHRKKILTGDLKRTIIGALVSIYMLMILSSSLRRYF